MKTLNRIQRPQRLTTRANDCWSMDFVSDQLTTGDRFRALTVIDIHTRECLAITVGNHLGGEEVVATLNVYSSFRDECLIVYSVNVVRYRNILLVITDQSFRVACWTCGLIIIK